MKKEIWSKGKNGGTVITDTADGLPENSGHSGTDAFDCYGGSLICESICRKKDVALISAAPDLLECCKTAKAIYEAQGINENSRIGGEQYQQLLQAINKAEDIS